MWRNADKNQDPTCEQTLGFILIKIPTPVLVPTEIQVWSNFWPGFDATWDLILIKIQTPGLI